MMLNGHKVTRKNEQGKGQTGWDFLNYTHTYIIMLHTSLFYNSLYYVVYKWCW